MPTGRAKKLPKNQPVPTALIGKLAVDKRIQGQGLGGILLWDALGQVLRHADVIAVHSVVVDAIDDDARRFYLRNGFEELPGNPLRLFIPLKVVRQLELESQDD